MSNKTYLIVISVYPLTSKGYFNHLYICNFVLKIKAKLYWMQLAKTQTSGHFYGNMQHLKY